MAWDGNEIDVFRKYSLMYWIILTIFRFKCAADLPFCLNDSIRRSTRGRVPNTINFLNKQYIPVIPAEEGIQTMLLINLQIASSPYGFLAMTGFQVI